MTFMGKFYIYLFTFMFLNGIILLMVGGFLWDTFL